MTRFLCVGDLHLGAGADYGREPGDRLRDQEAVWRQALNLAAEHDVEAVLFAGDAFHRRRPTPAEYRAFQRPLEAFTAEYGDHIEVVAIPGNHDVEAADAPTALDVFGRDVDLYTRPAVWWSGAARCGVACLPWAPVSRLVAARDGGDRDTLHAEAAELLIQTARGLRAQIEHGPAVLLTHWSISGASTPTGVQTDDFREVVLPLAELQGLGFDAVVAGHIHKKQILGDLDGAPVFYVGSPAPVDFGEAAVEHGVYLIDVDEFTAAPIFLPIESRPFVTLDFDFLATGGADFRGRLDFSGDVQDAVVRVRYTATEEQARRIDQGEIRRALYAAGAHKVYAIQADIVREQRARVEHVDEDLAPLDALYLWSQANDVADADWRALDGLTTDYLKAAA